MRTRAAEALPKFVARAKQGVVDAAEDVNFEYSYQDPFVPGCVDAMATIARQRGLTIGHRVLSMPEEAQRAASPFCRFGAFFRGRLLTQELTSAAKFSGMLDRAIAA